MSTTKKPATKEVQQELPEVQPVKQDSTEIIAILREENANLIESLSNSNCMIAELGDENGKLRKQLDELQISYIEPMTSTHNNTLTRNDVIKAMLPTIDTNYAKTNAESLAMSIDAICFAFGIES